MTEDEILRHWLLTLLNGELAHMSISKALADFPVDRINERPPNMTYSFWHLVEHLRITQWDILDYIRNPDYQEIEWPKDYWPDPDATTDVTGWYASIARFESDLEEIKAIVRDPATDFYAQIPHGQRGHNILREILVVSDHNSYHIGELGILRQVTNTWPAGHK